MLLNWTIEHVTLPMILAFVAGMMLCQGIEAIMNRRRIKAGKPCKSSGFNAVVGVVVVVTLIWIMVSTQQARDCAIKLNVSVAQEQELSAIERGALTQLFFQALNPPPNVVGRPADDPARKAWGKQLGDEYFTKIKATAAQREVNQAVKDQAQKACGR